MPRLYHLSRIYTADGQNSLHTQTLDQKQPSSEAFINIIPDEVLNHSGSFFSTLDLANMSRVSKNSRRIFRLDNKSELKERAVKQLLEYVVRGEQDKAEKMIKNNLDLLLQEGEVETYAKDLSGNPVIVRGTAFQLALGAEDESMAAMIVKYLDEHDADEKHKQYQKQFPPQEEEKKAENFSQTVDGKALSTIINIIGKTSDRACGLVLDHEGEISVDDEETQGLLTALNAFRDYLAPKKDCQTNKMTPIEVGKHFNIPLLIEAFKLCHQNYDIFGGRNSNKNNLCWRKLIGYMERFLPACYAQVFSQGIYHIVEQGEELRRSFDFRFKSDSYFPLDSDIQCRLGYDYARGSGQPGVGVGMCGLLLEKLYQAKAAALQRLMQQPCAQSQCCLVM